MYIMAYKLRFLDNENFISSTLFFGKWVKQRNLVGVYRFVPISGITAIKKKNVLHLLKRKIIVTTLKKNVFLIENTKYV